MGLNAVVYVYKNNLALNQEESFVKIDEHTGEVYFEDLHIAQRYPSSMFIAINKRLGNIDAVTALRDEILKIIDNNSVLYRKVLYNGSHSGDTISLEALDSLESEINFIGKKTTGNRSPALEVFLGDMSELIEAARTQKNPIVFV